MEFLQTSELTTQCPYKVSSYARSCYSPNRLTAVVRESPTIITFVSQTERLRRIAYGGIARLTWMPSRSRDW